MSITPNQLAFVQKRFNELNICNTPPYPENCARFLRIIAYEIQNGLEGAEIDTRCGIWRRSDKPWGHDGDKLCFLMPVGVHFVDIIVNAGSSNSSPSWQDDTDKYYDSGANQNNWMLAPQELDYSDDSENPDDDDVSDEEIMGKLDSIQNQLDEMEDKLSSLTSLFQKFSVFTAHGWLSINPGEVIHDDKGNPIGYKLVLETRFESPTQPSSYETLGLRRKD